jgi:hypothetical protein
LKPYFEKGSRLLLGFKVKQCHGSHEVWLTFLLTISSTVETGGQEFFNRNRGRRGFT